MKVENSKSAQDQKLVKYLQKVNQKPKIHFQSKLLNQVSMERKINNCKTKLKLWKSKFLFKINKTNYY